MPLAIYCGIPCSGKSTRAKELYDFLMSSKKCVLIKDDNVPSGFDRNKVYLDAQKEKELRSSLKSEVERHLSKDTTVILDAGNYIKELLRMIPIEQPLAATNFLYDLDKVTQGIVKSILNAQKLSTPGDFINIPKAEQKSCLRLRLSPSFHYKEKFQNDSQWYLHFVEEITQILPIKVWIRFRRF
ncbi:protein KTI12 homolog [Trichonephila inaurata madagascariensis]|uniref:Protein KTI12 homolog n=1 Tax=Trichonephila inaurata madagascariensis TaxID=2747483 RepID=A0A8X6XXT1_9ARAC|nr:protein KTI12 homolog [Trichonephila inaurata madagascariensis]